MAANSCCYKRTDRKPGKLKLLDKMYKNISILFMLLFSLSSYAQQSNAAYDSTLAKKLGADEYGMKQYLFVLIKTGPVTGLSKEVKDSLFAGHMANINRMVDQKKLIVAGPFMKNESGFRGLFILDVKDQTEAAQLMAADPAIHSGVLAVEYYPWYGSAALPVYLESIDKIWQKKP